MNEDLKKRLKSIRESKNRIKREFGSNNTTSNSTTTTGTRNTYQRSSTTNTNTNTAKKTNGWNKNSPKQTQKSTTTTTYSSPQNKSTATNTNKFPNRTTNTTTNRNTYTNKNKFTNTSKTKTNGWNKNSPKQTQKTTTTTTTTTNSSPQNKSTATNTNQSKIPRKTWGQKSSYNNYKPKTTTTTSTRTKNTYQRSSNTNTTTNTVKKTNGWNKNSPKQTQKTTTTTTTTTYSSPQNKYTATNTSKFPNRTTNTTTNRNKYPNTKKFPNSNTNTSKNTNTNTNTNKSQPKSFLKNKTSQTNEKNTTKTDNVDRREWLLLAMKRNPEIKNLRERVIPIARTESFGRLYCSEREEVKDKLTIELILQLIMQHLVTIGFKHTKKVIEEETKVKYKPRYLRDSRLQSLIRVALKNSDYIWDQTMNEEARKQSEETDSEIGLINYLSSLGYKEKEEDGEDLPSIWEEDSSENIIYVDNKLEEVGEEGSKEIRAASLNKLVQLLTHETDPNVLYLKTFLMTYQSFTTPKILFYKLTERYNIPTEKEEQYAKTKQMIKLRVCNFFGFG